MLKPIVFTQPEEIIKEILVPQECSCGTYNGQGAGAKCKCGSLNGGGNPVV